MEYRTLGTTGLQVSALSLGSWMTWEFMEEDDALAVLGAGIEAGINFLDDARYNDRTGRAPMPTGYSEVLFGRLLRRGGWKRDELILANKLWYEFYPQQTPEEELNASLARLQLDYLDIAYVEKPKNRQVREIVMLQDGLVKTGKLRYWGVLNWSAEEIAEAGQVAAAEGWDPPRAAQLPYSVLRRGPVEDAHTEAAIRAVGLGIVASYSLYGGLLTGKYNRAESKDAVRFKEQEIQAIKESGLLERAAKGVRVAQEVGCTPAQLALGYCLKNPAVSSVLFGVTSLAQLQSNLKALEVVPRLNEAILRSLRAI